MRKYISLNNWKTSGFTLIELMIVLAISIIISLGAYAAYSLQSRSYTTQREVSRVQQDLRGALYLIESDLLNACRDPYQSGRYRITNTGYYDYRTGALDNPMLPAAFAMPAAPSTAYFQSYPVLEFTSLIIDDDLDLIPNAARTVRYQIYDFGNDGRLDLCRRANAGMVLQAEDPAKATDILVAEGVVAIGFAFAYNPTPDGRYILARTPPAVGAPAGTLGNVIWAIDTNGDGVLDTNIDRTGDGDITLDDDTDDNGIIDNLDMAIGGAVALPGRAELKNIAAVRVWLLVQSDREGLENPIDRNHYVVGNRIIPPGKNAATAFNDRFVRRVETVTIALRNYRKT